MKHIRTLTQRPVLAQEGSLSTLESFILLLMGIFFSGFENYSTISRNLEKFYRKTD